MVCSAAISRCYQLASKEALKYVTRTTCLAVLRTILVYAIIFSFHLSFYLLKLYHPITYRIKTPYCRSWLANLYFLPSMEFFLEAKAISEHTCIAGGLFVPAIQIRRTGIIPSVKNKNNPQFFRHRALHLRDLSCCHNRRIPEQHHLNKRSLPDSNTPHSPRPRSPAHRRYPPTCHKCIDTLCL